MMKALRSFRNEADKADWAVVYYAGHGIGGGGVNYLIPVDATLADARDVTRRSPGTIPTPTLLSLHGRNFRGRRRTTGVDRVASGRPYGSKALINACKPHRYIKDFPPSTLLRRSVYERPVVERSALKLSLDNLPFVPIVEIIDDLSLSPEEGGRGSLAPCRSARLAYRGRAAG